MRRSIKQEPQVAHHLRVLPHLFGLKLDSLELVTVSRSGEGGKVTEDLVETPLMESVFKASEVRRVCGYASWCRKPPRRLTSPHSPAFFCIDDARSQVVQQRIDNGFA